jgi:putative transposase
VRLRHAWIDEPAWQLLGTHQGQRSYHAVTETLFGSLKVERLHGMRFQTRRQVKDEIIDWLTFYNRNRMHSTLGYMDPMTFEEVWRRQQETLAA